jgi:hypothetical protein
VLLTARSDVFRLRRRAARDAERPAPLCSRKHARGASANRSRHAGFHCPIQCRRHCVRSWSARSEKLPQDRYPSMREMLADLRRVARPSAADHPTTMPSRRVGWRDRLALTAVLVAAVAMGLALYLGGGRVASGPPPIRSIAVLPFKNLSGDSNQEYFSDGMTESLIASLAQIHSLAVTSRTSAMRFKDTKQSIPEIGRTLGVDAIVESSVQRSGNARSDHRAADSRVDRHAPLGQGVQREHERSAGARIQRGHRDRRRDSGRGHAHRAAAARQDAQEDCTRRAGRVPPRAVSRLAKRSSRASSRPSRPMNARSRSTRLC